jgi:cytochrome c-type biogenesis protein CcmH
MSMRALILALAVALFAGFAAVSPAHAVEPQEKLANPTLEARARVLSQELRCLVCQNQSIDDSNAELARDLRVLVRERLTAGDSDSQVLAFVEARYGEFVLLRPRFNARTLILWLTPLLFLGIAGYVIFRRGRASTLAASAAPLTDEEKRRLDQLLKSKP